MIDKQFFSYRFRVEFIDYTSKNCVIKFFIIAIFIAVFCVTHSSSSYTNADRKILMLFDASSCCATNGSSGVMLDVSAADSRSVSEYPYPADNDPRAAVPAKISLSTGKIQSTVIQ